MPGHFTTYEELSSQLKVAVEDKKIDDVLRLTNMLLKLLEDIRLNITYNGQKLNVNLFQATTIETISQDPTEKLALRVSISRACDTRIPISSFTE